jgi:hypothetical protein
LATVHEEIVKQLSDVINSCNSEMVERMIRDTSHDIRGRYRGISIRDDSFAFDDAEGLAVFRKASGLCG